MIVLAIKTGFARVEEKIKNIVEIGPGNVLSGLAKRSLSDVVISQISSFSDFSD